MDSQREEAVHLYLLLSAVSRNACHDLMGLNLSNRFILGNKAEGNVVHWGNIASLYFRECDKKQKIKQSQSTCTAARTSTRRSNSQIQVSNQSHKTMTALFLSGIQALVS